MKNAARVLLWIAGGFLLAACATTSLQSAWYDTSYRGGPFHRILVVGVGANLTDRRVFEDIFAQQLNTAGTRGIPGYQFLPDDARQNEPGWNEGVTRSGADGLLLVRVLGVDTTDASGDDDGAWPDLLRALRTAVGAANDRRAGGDAIRRRHRRDESV